MNKHDGVSGYLTSGTAVIVNLVGFYIPTKIGVTVVVGDTVTVSYSIDGGITYIVWPLGAITSTSLVTSDTLAAPITHVKFQRTAGAGTTSTYGVA